MRGRMKCWLVTVTALIVAVSMRGVSGARASLEVPHAKSSPGPGSQLWVKRYDGPERGADNATAEAVSPGGGTVFVTGSSQGVTSGDDYATVAYSTATGARLWVARYNGPGKGTDVAQSVAISPDGGTVYVTGSSPGTNSTHAAATVAYSVATGARLWVKRYNGPGNDSAGYSVAVSPDGGTVYVTGSSSPATGNSEYTTVAYNAATGAKLWATHYIGPYSYNIAHSVAVSPDGGTVFVTGDSEENGAAVDYATVAYNAATGAQLWVARYNADTKVGYTTDTLAVSPTGGTVFITGGSYDGISTNWDYATVAYNAATGAQSWVARYNDPGNGDDVAHSVAVSPDGGTVFVTGVAANQYVTVAYSATTGAQVWVASYSGPGDDVNIARSVAVSPSGAAVYVTGQVEGATSESYATVAYNAATGAQLWAALYASPGNGFSNATAVTARPTGGRVFVTGTSQGTTTGLDYAAIAYRG